MKQKFALSLPLRALLGVAALVVYVAVLSALVFNNAALPPIFAPAAFLLLFVFSAMVCGLALLGYPAFLTFIKAKPRDALVIIVWEIIWLAVVIMLYFVSRLAL